uniref:Cell cycle checkpoint control protein RAD9A n=1 Tax=Arion vulgaris TaxID=1028688 RepID=A0A0B6ZL02_9EUPU
MSSLKCTIPGLSLKVFGRAILSLSKIGDELYFEPLEDGLFLRSVNSSRSAYGSFQFSPSFFSNYVIGVTDKDGHSEDDDDDVLRCKLGMKSIMAVFKSLPTIDKMVEKCRVSLDVAEARLIFQMYCRHGIIKTHKLAFIECETLQAVFSKDMCPNKLTAVAKLLCDAVLNFQNNQEEITLIIRPNYVALKNYVDDEPDPHKVVHTELTLSPEEFEQYQAGVDADITFCLKELRAILAFADIAGLPVTLHFESAGRPITFSITTDLSFEANYVLATLADEESSAGNLASTSNKNGTHNRRGNTGKQNSVSNGRNSINRNSSNSSSSYAERHKNSTDNYSKSRNSHERVISLRDEAGPSNAVDDEMIDNDELSVMMDVTAAEDSYTSQHPVVTSDKNKSASVPQDRKRVLFLEEDDEEEDDTGWTLKARTAKNFLNPKPDLAFKDNPAELRKGNLNTNTPDETIQNNQDKHVNLPQQKSTTSSNSSNSETSVQQKYLSLKSAKTCDSETSPVIPVQDTNLCPSDKSEDEEIPVTPPSKKFRSVFFGTQSSTQSTQSQQKAVILAPDSEDDD